MRPRSIRPALLAAVLSTPLTAHLASAAPAYNIYPFSPVGTDTTGTGQGISATGNFATGYTQRSDGSNGVLYNVSAGTTTVQAQTGVIYGASTVEKYGAPFSVNNQGIMFGSSGATSAVQTGAPTVFDGGQAYNLPLPLYSGAGQVYGCSNYVPAYGCTFAGGSVGSASGGLNQAALFKYFGPNSASNITVDLTQGTTSGGTLQTAYGVNDSLQVVGTASNPNNAATTDGYFLDLGNGATSATIIPTSSASFNSTIPFAINNNITDNRTALVAGSETLYGANGVPFLYNSSSGATVAIPLVYGASGGGARGVNSSGEVVGTQSGAYALPFLYDGTASYLLSSLLANNMTGAWHLSDNTSSGGFGIADNGDIVGRGFYNGVLTGFVMIPTGGTITTPQQITFNNTGGTGDGVTWDSTQQNFNNGSSPVVFNGTAGDFVTFNDSNNGHYTVNVPGTVTPGATIVNNSSGNYVFNGAGTIGGGGGLQKYGTGTLTLDTVNTYAGTTFVNGGTLVVAVNGALPVNTKLGIGGTATSVVIGSVATPYALQLTTLSINNGTLDLRDNAMIVHSTTFSIVVGYVKGGYNGGSGVVSSLSNSVRTLGIVANNIGSGAILYGTGGTVAPTFYGATPVAGDTLVRLTYYGDANLDGKVDGSDYSRIDNGFLTPALTGWYNGDFNYDGVVNASDYTLIDNAYNRQGQALSPLVAYPTALTAGSPAAVPEPASVGLIAAVALLARRRRV